MSLQANHMSVPAVGRGPGARTAASLLLRGGRRGSSSSSSSSPSGEAPGFSGSGWGWAPSSSPSLLRGWTAPQHPASSACPCRTDFYRQFHRPNVTTAAQKIDFSGHAPPGSSRAGPRDSLSRDGNGSSNEPWKTNRVRRQRGQHQPQKQQQQQQQQLVHQQQQQQQLVQELRGDATVQRQQQQYQQQQLVQETQQQQQLVQELQGDASVQQQQLVQETQQQQQQLVQELQGDASAHQQSAAPSAAHHLPSSPSEALPDEAQRPPENHVEGKGPPAPPPKEHHEEPAPLSMGDEEKGKSTVCAQGLWAWEESRTEENGASAAPPPPSSSRMSTGMLGFYGWGKALNGIATEGTTPVVAAAGNGHRALAVDLTEGEEAKETAKKKPGRKKKKKEDEEREQEEARRGAAAAAEAAAGKGAASVSAGDAVPGAAEEEEEEEEGELDVRQRWPEADYAAVEDSDLLEEILLVRDKEEAHRVAALLTGKYRDFVFACDTEVAFIDVKSESPVGHGQVICFSIYGGPQVSLAEGSPVNGEPLKTMLWVDTYGTRDEAEAEGIMDVFKPFFKDPSIAKVWHNFSFDRHVLNNHDVECGGLAGDTIHMARMYDASRLQGGGPGYGLEALSSDPVVMGREGKEGEAGAAKKTGMKEIFQQPVIKKDGTEGKLRVMAPVHELQLDPEQRAKWIKYSAMDARATHELYCALKTHLEKMECHPNGFTLPPSIENMWDLYKEYWLPFGQLLTDMEAAGVLVNREHLATGEVQALKDQEAARERFKAWASSVVPDAAMMNVTSGTQVRQLFFAGAQRNQKPNEEMEIERVFKVPNEDPDYIEEGKKRWKKTRDITIWGAWGRGVPSPLKPEHWTPSGWPATSTPALRVLAGKSMAALKALEELGEVEKLGEVTPLDDEEPTDESEAGAASAAAAALANVSAADTRKLEAEAKSRGFGLLYPAFGGGVAGMRACAAADALVEINAIDTLLSNFIVPLQGDKIATPDKRVHCSLNINTETGRLSARRPNLQNQPALEKDRYKIRKAFTANVAEGKTLIVADYGQLELRLLAHMAKCRSMREAFELGGDFHSRTALGMYDYIKEDTAAGNVLLEWDYPDGQPPPVPLIKDKYGSERRKAKVLNFSIAYGKTAHGLAKDFGTGLQEAKDTVERWYADRSEVRDWQKRQREWAKQEGYVTTLLGRRRNLPDINSSTPGLKGRAERAAINTPIQGSAADVAAAAMVAIDRCEELRELGWVLLLQVHDEVMLEGPVETAERAQELVVECMAKPFQGENPLSVDLSVDSNIGTTWYEAK